MRHPIRNHPQRTRWYPCNYPRFTGVHEHAEDKRRGGQAGIESGIHQPVDASERAGSQARCGGCSHEHIPRWARDSHTKTHQGHDPDHGPTRHQRKIQAGVRAPQNTETKNRQSSPAPSSRRPESRRLRVRLRSQEDKLSTPMSPQRARTRIDRAGEMAQSSAARRTPMWRKRRM